MKTILLILASFFLSFSCLKSQEWPMWAGPYGNFIADSDDTTNLGEKFWYPELVWISEDTVPPAKGYGSGSASPIIYNNKVYIYYCRDDNHDVISCFSADSGKLLWKKEYPGANYWIDPGKGSPKGHSMCAGNGMVYAFGFANKIYALDAENGDEIWQKSFYCNSHSANAVFIDSVVVMPGNKGEIAGFDADSGTLLWSHNDIIGNAATPSIYDNGSKKYLVVGDNKGEISFIDLKNGNILWELTGKGYNSHSIVVAENLMIIQENGELDYYNNEGNWSCYEISTSGATLRCFLDTFLFKDSMEKPIILNEKAYVTRSDYVLSFDLKTGKLIGQFPLSEAGCSFLTSVDGKIIIEPDASHTYDHTAQLVMVDTSDSNFRILDQWFYPNPKTSSYQVQMTRPIINGRVYIRGKGYIYCYDIQKECTKGQEITFNSINNKNAIDTCFEISAYASSGLTVDYSIKNGPAYISNDTVYLTGEKGVVVIEGGQPGNGLWCPANIVTESFAVGDPTPPKPNNFSATSISTNQIELNWDDSSSLEAYYIIVRKNNNDKWVQIAKVDGDSTSFTDVGLDAGNKYIYKVYGMNGYARSEYSDNASAVTYNIDVEIWVEPECESVPVGWDVVNDTNASNGQYVKAIHHIGGGGQPGPEEIISFSIEIGLEAEYQIWTYALAYGGGDDSFYWTFDTVRPFNGVGINGTGSWTWNATGAYYLNAGIHTYHMGIREDGAMIDKIYITTKNDAPSGLDDQAINCISGNIPDAPTSLLANNVSETETELTWNDLSDNEEMFLIERKKTPDNYQLIGSARANATSFTDENCESGETYSYRVRAYNLFGSSSHSNEALASIPAASVVAAPTGLTVSLNNGTIKLSWNDNSSNEIGFMIQRHAFDWSYSDFQNVPANQSSFSYPVDQLSTDYTFRIYAYSQSKKSNYSNEAIINSGTNHGVNLNISRSSEIITIDGIMEDQWSNTSVHSLGNIIIGETSPNETIGCQFRSLWDDIALYFYIEITDDNLNADGIYYYEDDGIELFFDIGNEKSNQYDENDYVYYFILESSDLERLNRLEGVSRATRVTSNGYSMEIKIPWNTLEVTNPVKNVKFGFDIYCIDDDWEYKRTDRENLISWHSMKNDMENTPLFFGTAMLVDSLKTNIYQEKEQINDPELMVYPNPTTGIINLKYEKQISAIEKIAILNQWGIKLFETSMINKIDISELPNGIYFVKTRTGVNKILKY